MNTEYWENLFYMVFPLCKDSDLEWWIFSSHETDEIYEEDSVPEAKATVILSQAQAVCIDDYDYNNETNLVTI